MLESHYDLILQPVPLMAPRRRPGSPAGTKGAASTLEPAGAGDARPHGANAATDEAVLQEGAAEAGAGSNGSTAYWTLGRLVAMSGVPASSVHHYRRLGLLPALRVVRNGRFAYAEHHLKALLIIRELREERAMPLRQIREVLPALMEGRRAVPPMLEDTGGEPHGRLLDAAFKLFSEPRGYASVTVSEIAAAAGVAKGSVYRHFSSKEALFTAVVESLCEDTARRFAGQSRISAGRKGSPTTRGRLRSSSPA